MSKLYKIRELEWVNNVRDGSEISAVLPDGYALIRTVNPTTFRLNYFGNIKFESVFSTLECAKNHVNEIFQRQASQFLIPVSVSQEKKKRVFLQNVNSGECPFYAGCADNLGEVMESVFHFIQADLPEYLKENEEIEYRVSYQDLTDDEVENLPDM